MKRLSVFSAVQRLIVLSDFCVFAWGEIRDEDAMLNGVVRFMCNGGKRVARGRA